MAVPAIPLLDAPPLQRYGRPSLEYGASPAAGAHFTQKIAGNYLVRLVSVFCRLVTDSNVADRQVIVEYRDSDGNRFSLSGSNATQAASLTGDWYFTPMQPYVSATVDGTVLQPLVPLLLTPTQDFRIYVPNIAAADQLSRIRFVWERFFTSGEPG
jgi:hypothetical protein